MWQDKALQVHPNVYTTSIIVQRAQNMFGRTINISNKEQELEELETLATCPARNTQSLLHQGVSHFVPGNTFSKTNSLLKEKTTLNISLNNLLFHQEHVSCKLINF